VRLTAWASAAGFAVLAAVLAVVGAVPWNEAAWAAAAAALALGPGGWWSGEGMGRRAAELLLVTAAFALTMIGDPAMRRMVLAPLLVLVAWAAAAAAWRRVPAGRRPPLAAALGLAVRAATGLGLAGFGVVPTVMAVALAAAAPWAAARRIGPRAAELTALAAGVLPWQRWPLAAAALTAVCAVWGAVGSRRWRTGAGLGWLPGFGAAALLLAALAAWPTGIGPGLLPGIGWTGWAALAAALLLSLRLPPGAAGAAWFAAVLAVAAPLAPTPEHRAFDLEAELGTWTGPPAAEGPWVVDLEVRGGGALDPETPVAILGFAGGEHLLRAAAPDGTVIHRPGTATGRRGEWRRAVRHSFDVPRSERPRLRRHPALPEDVVVRVETVGPARPTPPRAWPLARWLPAAAVAVMALQLLAGTWRSSWAVLPWLPLVLGMLAARVPVEPLHLAAERLAPDIALAAMLAAWLPAAREWLLQRRVFAAVAALLVPLALATPQLTPPLYGDEPFHLLLMESLAEDHDLDIGNNLDLNSRPQNALYAPGRPLFHPPALGLLLLPGYLLGGRTGSLVLLALMGAGATALIARRARDLGVGERRVGLLVVLLTVTYPLAIFAIQIWPELPGALAVAALLVLAARSGLGGRLAALVVAVVAAAVKTRLALLAFPVAAATWLRRRPLRGAAVLVVAAAAVLLVGWLTMGHPFGPYRRLHHLLPTDPGLVVRVLGGLLFDPAGGLAFNAPLLLLAAAGAAALWRRGGPGERALLAGCGLTVAALLHSSEWYGGGAPPARYLVPMLPAAALAGGLLLERAAPRRRLGLLLLPPSVAAWWLLLTRPHHSVNPGDGGYWLADALARRFGADARSLFPSFLVPNTATVVVPLVMVLLLLAAWRLAAASPAARAVLRRLWVAVWLVAGAALVLSLDLRYDRVVELEAPQVRRHGGAAVPEAGAVARYSHRRGWRLDDGDAVSVPLHLRADSEIALEGWLVGTARQRSALTVRWNEGEPAVLRWRGEDPPERVLLPPPPGGGRHLLHIRFSGPPNGAVVLDRLLVEPIPAPTGERGRR
jgi:hypothetical protein